MENLIEFRNIDVKFRLGKLTIHALRGINLELRRGEVLGLVGESGSGKSVLIHSVFRTLPDDAVFSGEIIYKGVNLLSMDEKKAMKLIGKNFSLVPQGFGSLNPVLKSWLQIMERPMEHFGFKKDEAYRVSKDLLKKLFLEDPEKIASAYRHQLSGGMLQRVLVAMGISGKTEAIFFDEPTKGLDTITKKILLELLKLARSMTESMLVVSHDLEFIERIADRIAVIHRGEIVEISEAKEFFENPKHPYSRMLIDSAPSKGLKKCFDKIDFNSEGCSYHPICQRAREICKRNKPSWIKLENSGLRCLVDIWK